VANPVFSLIIPAAGRGERMQADIPKPYLQLGDCTVLEHALSCFIDLPGLKQVIAATSGPYRDQTEKILHRLIPDLHFKVVQGGAERMHSIYNAIEKVDPESELIAVHDAVRPFVSKTTILECLKQAAVTGGAIPGVRVNDTIKRVDDQGKIKETPDRSELWQAQTPQIFKRSILLKAYENALSTNMKATDDASLVEAIGGAVAMVTGSRTNFKLTYPIDFKIAEILVQELKTGHLS